MEVRGKADEQQIHLKLGWLLLGWGRLGGRDTLRTSWFCAPLSGDEGKLGLSLRARSPPLNDSGLDLVAG